MQSKKSDHEPATAGWQYKLEQATSVADSTAPEHAPAASAKPVQWTASEFIEHQKNAVWYFMLMGAGFIIAGFIYLITHDRMTAIAIFIIFGLFAIFAGRKPRTLEYAVDEAGIHIGQKTYVYGEFRSFSVRDEGAVQSITLMPLRRFMPPISLYYAEKDEDGILDVIGSYLPFQPSENDPIDNLMRKIRF